MKTSHTQFNIDRTHYLIESNCIQALWPCLFDKTIRYLERVGKKPVAGFFWNKIKYHTNINKNQLNPGQRHAKVRRVKLSKYY